MIKIILPAKQIPINQTVFKINGTKPYRLTDRIAIIGENKQELFATSGTLILVDLQTGNASSIIDTYELIWNTYEETLIDYLHQSLDNMDDK